MPEMDKESLDKVFCITAKKYGLKKLFLKAVAIRESSLNQRAYRFEPGFWANHSADILAKYPDLEGRDINEVSASYGLMQLMFTTAWAMGFRGIGEELYDPILNVEFGARLLRTNLDLALSGGYIFKPIWDDEKKTWKFKPNFFWLSPADIALARYNGGGRGNPDAEGSIRNYKYVKGVLKNWDDLIQKEKDCDEEG